MASCEGGWKSAKRTTTRTSSGYRNNNCSTTGAYARQASQAGSSTSTTVTRPFAAPSTGECGRSSLATSSGDSCTGALLAADGAASGWAAAAGADDAGGVAGSWREHAPSEATHSNNNALPKKFIACLLKFLRTVFRWRARVTTPDRP